MIGFGDPIFDPQARAQASAEIKGSKSRLLAKTRAYTDFWKGSQIDRAALAASLPPLLDTADERTAVNEVVAQAGGAKDIDDQLRTADAVRPRFQ